MITNYNTLPGTPYPRFQPSGSPSSNSIPETPDQFMKQSSKDGNPAVRHNKTQKPIIQDPTRDSPVINYLFNDAQTQIIQYE